MSTSEDYMPPSSLPPKLCERCRHPMRLGATFCPHCGNRRQDAPSTPERIARQNAIKDGEVVGPAASSYPVPPVALKLPRNPLGDSSQLRSLFPSGPLPEPSYPEAKHLLWETPTWEPTPINALPDWLSNAVQADGSLQSPAPVGPSWMVAEPSHPLGPVQAKPAPIQSDDLVSASDPTLRRIPLPPKADYGPQPDGKILCTTCWGQGMCEQERNGARVFDTCPLCKGERRIPAPDAIPQPMPDADISGATFRLETAQVDMPADTPQITEPIEQLQREEQDRQANAQESVANVLEWLDRVGMQAAFMATTLRALAEHSWHGDEFIFVTSGNFVRQIGDLVEHAMNHLTGWQETEEERRGK